MSRQTFQKFRRSGVAGTREFSGMAEPYHMVETVLHPYYFSSYTDGSAGMVAGLSPDSAPDN
ncbi:hypothetical protein DE4585_03022 [Mycobacteroides salmoniphilum]|uniref:Uncharacterized protein n=1 Tax=Mycobacteroides salmoniphilum TaxID=404941 RepID=A0A4R8RXH4_9MYCO|nr:hypothetical protein DE4585_03022 [Mycobacteroides salmoniphilum]